MKVGFSRAGRMLSAGGKECPGGGPLLPEIIAYAAQGSLHARGKSLGVRGVFNLARGLLASRMQLNASYGEPTMTLNTASIYALSNGTAAAAGNDNTKTKSGTYESSLHGEGTFSKTMEEVNGLKTIDKTITLGNGKTRSIETTIITNEDGSKTISHTKNGKTTTTTESETTNADGTISISKEKTKADGSVIEISGTKSSVKGETDSHIVRTNADGQTETLDRQMIKDGHTKTYTTTGTGYDGSEIDKESTWTTLV